MSHDRRLNPATLETSIADDRNYTIRTTYENEDSAGHIQPQGVADDGVQPPPTYELRCTTDTVSTLASGTSREDLSHSRNDGILSGINEATSHRAHQCIDEVEPPGQTYPYDAGWQAAEGWQDDALQAIPSESFMLWEPHFDQALDSSFPNYAEDLSNPGLEFDQSYSELLDNHAELESYLLQQRSLNAEFEVHNSEDTVVKDGPLLIRPPSAASDRSGTSIAETQTWRCEYCSTEFYGIHAQGNYRRHQRLKHNSHSRQLSREYICQEWGCSKTFQRQDARLKHYRKHHPHRASDLVIRRPTRARHQDDYHVSGNTRDAEDAIHELLSSTLSEPTTEVAPTDVGSIQCDICQKEFNRAAELRRHKKSIHNLNSQQYFCTVPGCDRASRPFLRKDKLADHTARVHAHSTSPGEFEHGKEAAQTSYSCDYPGCERVFDHNAGLLRHRRIHTDKSERPHKCAQCEQSFLYPKDLKRHQATHSDENDGKSSFHCEVASCEYGPGRQGFSRKDGMIRHMRRFHPELVVEKET